MQPTVDLGQIIERAASGRFPPVDGGWERATPWSPVVEGIVAMTGHAYLAVHDDPPPHVAALVDGYGGAHDPRVIAALAGPQGWMEALDVILVGGLDASCVDRPNDGLELVERADLMSHPRAQFASAIRQNVRALGVQDPACTSVVTVGRGVAGLPEIGIELDESTGPNGTALVAAALAHLREPLVLACVAPGNARALRLFQGCGFVAVGSVQLFSRRPDLMRAL